MTDKVEQAIRAAAAKEAPIPVEIALAAEDGGASERRAVLVVPQDLRNDDALRIIHSTLETLRILTAQRTADPVREQAKRSGLWAPASGGPKES